MSATNRSATSGHVRHPQDFYSTEGWVVRAILPHLDLRGKRVLEPSCGDGAILRELVGHGARHICGVEIDYHRSLLARTWGASIINDNFLANDWPLQFDIAIGNPPFSLAMEFVQECTRVATTTAMLLRLGFLASIERSAWLRTNTPSVYVLPKRPSFAASVKCKQKCGFAVSLPLDAERPKRCPDCGGRVTVCTSDSADYGWFLWDGKPPTVRILEVE